MTGTWGASDLISYEENDPTPYYGKKIVNAEVADDACRILFEGGPQICIFDDGQSCCEHRFMTTDDNIKSLIGNTLVRIEAKDGPTEDAEYNTYHETCFVEIATDKGFVTLTNHNEHNGYYGGFVLQIEEEKVEK